MGCVCTTMVDANAQHTSHHSDASPKHLPVRSSIIGKASHAPHRTTVTIHGNSSSEWCITTESSSVGELPVSSGTSGSDTNLENSSIPIMSASHLLSGNQIGKKVFREDDSLPYPLSLSGGGLTHFVDERECHSDRDGTHPVPHLSDLEDILCDRDDDPPIVDDEIRNPNTVFQQHTSKRRRTNPSVPSLHSARKSMVSFSESVSVVYDKSALDGDEDDDDATERGTMNFDLDEVDDSSPTTHHMHAATQPFVAFPAIGLQPSTSRSCATLHRPPFDETNSSTSAITMTLVAANVFSDVSSVTSSRGTVVTLKLAGDASSHREQRARPRI